MIPKISNPTRQMFDVAASSAAPAKSKPLFHRVQLSSVELNQRSDRSQRNYSRTGHGSCGSQPS